MSDLTTAFHLNNNHLHLMVHWVGKGSKKVFCLARDQAMEPGATSQVFASDDYGKTFADISGRLTLEDGRTNATIAKFYHHPESNCQYVFTDTVNRYLFTSTDCGETFSRHKLELTPSLIEFDGNRDLVFLVHDLVDERKTLYVTRNFGETFSHVQEFVKAFFFKGGEGEQGELFVQRMEPGLERSNILSSR